MSNKRTTPKPKSLSCYGTTTEVTSLELSIDQNTGDINIADLQPGTMKVAMEYSRISGKNKATVVVPTDKPNCFKDVTAITLSSYDYIFAVDTNKVAYKNDTICVTSIYHIPRRLSTYKTEIPILQLASFIIKNPKPGINTETIGWHIFFKNVLSNANITNKGYTIGVVVDSELGKHPKINTREIPYYMDNLLPENTCLIYASSAAATETLPNALINLCDRASTMILNKIITEDREISLQPNGDEYYEGFTRVIPLGDQTKSPIRKFNFK